MIESSVSSDDDSVHDSRRWGFGQNALIREIAYAFLATSPPKKDRKNFVLRPAGLLLAR